jgi:hypothetical protein
VGIVESTLLLTLLIDLVEQHYRSDRSRDSVPDTELVEVPVALVVSCNHRIF